MSYDEMRYHNDAIDFFGPPKAKPCTCVATRDAKLDARMADGRRRLDSTIAELTAMRIEREQRDAEQERARIEQEHRDQEMRDLRKIQDQLDRAQSIRDFARGLADSERFAREREQAAEQAARERADADESLAAVRIALRGTPDNRRAEDIARERADRDQQKRWRR